MAAPVGQLTRAIQHIHVGAAHSTRKRENQNKELGMSEIDLQYQLPISGEAAKTPVFASLEVNFEYEFHYAPLNRESDLEVPHMTFGAYIPGVPVGVHACVMAWKVNKDNGGITGAKVAVGVVAEGQTPFNGHLHVTFSGWALSRDDLSDNPDIET